MVRFMPICTDTGVPPTSMVILPLRYQPSEPVENSLTSACNGTSPTLTVTALALVRKSLRVMGQVVFLAMTGSSVKAGCGRGAVPPLPEAASYLPRPGRDKDVSPAAAFSPTAHPDPAAAAV